jgi:hypothetical protein
VSTAAGASAIGQIASNQLVFCDCKDRERLSLAALFASEKFWVVTALSGYGMGIGKIVTTGKSTVTPIIDAITNPVIKSTAAEAVPAAVSAGHELLPMVINTRSQ